MATEIRSLWIGERLGTFERLCIRSFLDHGHPFRLFTYQEIEGVPEGTVLDDGNNVLPEALSVPFRRPGASIAHFADWFRWELLKSRGGFWVDMDIVCIRPFDFEDPVVFGNQDPFNPNVSVLRFPALHPLTLSMVDRCENPHRVRPGDSLRRRARKALRRLRGGLRSDVDWGEAGGPFGFREALAGGECEHLGLPYTVFYPVHHQHWPCIFDETFKGDDTMLFADTHGLHLWGELFRKFSAQSADDSFHPGSLFEQLKRKHLRGT